MFNITTTAGQKLALLSIKIGKLKIRVRKPRTETGSATTLRLVTIYVMDVYIQLHNLNTFATPKVFQSKPANSINKGLSYMGLPMLYTAWWCTFSVVKAFIKFISVLPA